MIVSLIQVYSISERCDQETFYSVCKVGMYTGSSQNKDSIELNTFLHEFPSKRWLGDGISTLLKSKNIIYFTVCDQWRRFAAHETCLDVTN